MRPILVASAGAFVAAMSTSLVAVSIPVIARELHVPPADVSWVLTAYLLAVSCLLALVGKVADVVGRRRVYLAGFFPFLAGSIACALAPTLGTLVAGRVVQGTGAAMLMAVGPAIVTHSVPPARRARSLGIQLAATYIGLTLGPGVGGLLAAAVGWHAVFLVIAGVGAIAGVVATAFLPRDEPSTTAPSVRALDLAGATLLAVALAALLVALKRTRTDGWTGTPVLALAGLAAIVLVVFVRHERGHPLPLLPPALFRAPAFSLGIAGAVLLYTVQFMLSYLLPFQLQREAGLGPAAAGAYMMAQPAAMAVIAPLAGAVTDRSGPRIPSTLGMLAIGAGMAMVGFTAQTPGALLVLSLVVIGIGAGLYVAPNTSLVMGSAPRDRQSVAGAMVATARNLGMTLGIALAASLEAALGFRQTLLVASVLAVCGALLGAIRPIRSAETA